MQWSTRLRSRIAFLILITLLPTAALIVHDRYEARAAAEAAAIMEVARVAEALIEAQRVLVQDVEDLLDVLALTQQVREFDEPDCGDFLQAVLKSSPQYLRLVVFTPEGHGTCRRDFLETNINSSDQSWFRQAVETKRFVVGDYRVGRLSGQPQLSFARPILGEDGSVLAVLYAGVRPSWVRDDALRYLLPPADRFVIVDGKGTALARFPDEVWVGKEVADTPLFRAMVQHPSGYIAELPGVDGQSRLFHLVHLGSDPSQAIYAAVGMPIEEVRSEIYKGLALQLFVLTLIGLAVLGTAMLVSGPLIAWPIRQLVSLSEHIAAGDLSIRSGVNHKAGELGELAKGLDRMADALLRNRAELSEKNHLLNVAQAIAHIGTWIWRPSSGRLERSEELDRILGIDHQTSSATEKVMVNAIHVQDRDRFRGLLDRIKTDGGRMETELRAVHSDGTVRDFWCVIQGQELEGGGDPADRKIVRGVMQDISERKQAEAERERTNRFISVMLDNISDGIIACDTEGRLILFNKALEGMHQVSARDVVSGHFKAALKIYEPDGKTLISSDSLPLHRALNGEPVSNKEIVLKPLGMAPLTVLVSGQPIMDGQGERIGAVVCVHDVTEQRQTESVLRQAQKLESVGRLTGGIAHDFNNLLSIVIGNLDSLLRRLKAPDEREIANEALEGALRGTELTKQMLAFSRQQRLDAIAVDVGSLLQGMIARVTRMAGDRVRTQFNIPQDLWPCLTDPGQFESVLLHMAVNSRDAMVEGGTLTIEAANSRLEKHCADHTADMAPGDYVRVSVVDTGTGIPANLLSRVLEPFFTTKEPGKGSGLGLSVVYGFAKQSGGYLKIESQVGKGTAVHLYSPRAASVKEISEASNHAQQATGLDERAILVVDDDAAVRRTTARLLTDAGYNVIEVEHPSAALETLAGNARIDLVLSDVAMPGGMNGYDLALQVAERYSDVKVLLVTGFAENAARTRDAFPGRVEWLAKPYRQQELVTRIQSILR